MQQMQQNKDTRNQHSLLVDKLSLATTAVFKGVRIGFAVPR